MVMVADLLPGLKRFLSGARLTDAGLRMVMRMAKVPKAKHIRTKK